MTITLTFPTFKHAPGQDYPGDDTTSFTGHQRRGSANPGVDFGTPVGTPVYAPCRIRITEIWRKDTGSGGLYVRARCIDDQGQDSGFVILCLHLSEILCNLGDEFDRGDLFALTGESGGVVRHLHFTLILDGTHVDPMLYLVDAAGLVETQTTHQPTQEERDEMASVTPAFVVRNYEFEGTFGKTQTALGYPDGTLQVLEDTDDVDFAVEAHAKVFHIAPDNDAEKQPRNRYVQLTDRQFKALIAQWPGRKI